jgi:flagella basal body P-ring formation protein FlgA
MTARSLQLLLAAAALLAGCAGAAAQASDDATVAPVLRANVSVASEVVRIGDVVENAGNAAQIAIYRAPDLGTTGTLPTAQVVATLRTYQVIGVDTKGLSEISVTRLARTLESKEIGQLVARTLEHRNGLGDAKDILVTFDRELRALQLDASSSGELHATYSRFDPRSGRFDVQFEVANTGSAAPARMRFTGTAVETVEAAVLERGVELNEVIKSSDVAIERRPKAEVGNDPARRDQAVGMKARRALRAGQALRVADLARPDWVQRDQMVTLVYEADGLFLTLRAKALDAGSEDDQVSVMNPQSKRTVQGVVTGPGQVSVSVATPRPVTTLAVTTSGDQPPPAPKAE